MLEIPYTYVRHYQPISRHHELSHSFCRLPCGIPTRGHRNHDRTPKPTDTATGVRSRAAIPTPVWNSATRILSGGQVTINHYHLVHSHRDRGAGLLPLRTFAAPLTARKCTRAHGHRNIKLVGTSKRPLNVRASSLVAGTISLEVLDCD